MQRTYILFLAAVATLAGCAGAPETPATDMSMGSGRHLVYRDASGTPIRQFSYPQAWHCRRVEAMAGRAARCQPEPVGGMEAQALLRYDPPGILVEGRYADLARCRADTRTMSSGVQLVNACSPI